MCFCDPLTPTRGTYAGIGARATPPDVLDLMRELAAKLATENWTLRTGGAAGADQAFLEGAISVRGCHEVYLPWPGYNDHTECHLAGPSHRAYEMAAEHHPAWSVCGPGAKALHARNCHQIPRRRSGGAGQLRRLLYAGRVADGGAEKLGRDRSGAPGGDDCEGARLQPEAPRPP